MASPNVPPNRSRRRRVILGLTLLVLVILALLLLRLRCDGPAGPGAFDYFKAKAAALNNDADRILKFVRDEVRPLPYRGDVKGALGSLWDGAGSPEEKVSLARALLAHASTPRTAGLDDVAPRRDKAADKTGTQYKLTITHRLGIAGAAKETPVFSGPAGSLVGDVHTIDMPDASTTRIVLRGGAGATKVIGHSDAVSEEIVFTVERPGGKPLTVVRELWHKDNRTGPRGPLPGDRHDFVVLPCRVDAYVREKEELLLSQRGRKDAPEARGYLALLDYLRQSDEVLGLLEKHKKVRAQFELPRILILSRFNLPATPGYAFDLRLNRTAFEGGRVEAHIASQMRSFIESGLEQHFLTGWSGMPSSSTYDVFCQLRGDYPNNQPRRIENIVAALAALGQYPGPDGKVTFRARPADGRDTKDSPAVVATRQPGGAIRLVGGPVNPAFARDLAKAKIDIPYASDGRLDASFDALPQAALAAEVTLMAAHVRPAVSPAYVLETTIDCGAEPLVSPEARFHFAWGEGAGKTDQRIRIVECSDALQTAWRVQDSTRPASGTRTVSESALAEATVHNPWYRAGDSQQDKVTSFCVSRKVLAALKSGRSIDMAMEGRYTEKDDPDGPRPREWKGPVSPAGAATCRVRINGQEEDIRTVRCNIRGAPVAILDDALYPVGMADKLVEVWTSIRGRVVDENGLGISNATVRIGEEKDAVTVVTWPDGNFRLPPSSIGGYGKAKVTVLRHDVVLGRREVDLTAPGRKAVTISVPRNRNDLVFLAPREAERLKKLPLSDQAKRHALRDLQAGRLVVIPGKMVRMGPGRTTVGYYAYDVLSGNIVGVTEDGLNGSNTLPDAEWEAALASMISDLIKTRLKPPKSPLPFIHLYRGAHTAAWTYCTYRLEGLEHAEAIIRMVVEMDSWEKATNLMENFGEAAGQLPWTRDGGWNKEAGDKAKEKLTKLIDKSLEGINDDWAKFAFKLGYLNTCAGLAVKLQGS